MQYPSLEDQIREFAHKEAEKLRPKPPSGCVVALATGLGAIILAGSAALSRAL